MPEFELTFICKTEQNTSHIGSKVSTLSRCGDVFALDGALGMGKSVFARAFVQNLCGDVDVPSPTFTLVQMYDAPLFRIYHFDLYRLKSPEEIFELGIEEAMYDGVCLIEWPSRMGGYLPRKAVKIQITPDKDGRRIKMIFADKETYERFAVLKDEQ